MNKTQALNKLKKLTLLSFIRDNLTKFIIPLKYSFSEATAQKEMMLLLSELPFTWTDQDFKYLFSLSLRDLARFTVHEDINSEMQKLRDIVGVNKKVPYLLGEE